MQIPDEFTPSQKMIVAAYIEFRSVPKAAVATHHTRDSSYVREVIRKYKVFLREEDRRLHTADAETCGRKKSVTLSLLCSFSSSDPCGGCM